MTEQLVADRNDAFDDLAIELCFSNLNFSEPEVALGGLRMYQQELEQIEDGEVLFVGGLEVTPTRRLIVQSFQGKFRKEAAAVAAGKRPLVSRLHQAWAPSFRSVRDPFGAAAFATMPEASGSIFTLARMSEQLGHVPQVVYADQRDAHGALFDFGAYGNANAAQIMPEAVRAIGDSRYMNYHMSNQQRAIAADIVDNHHLVRASTDDPEYRLDWQQVLHDFIPAGAVMGGVHASAGRVDTKFDEDRKRSMQELRALLKGPEALGKTVMGEVMAESYRIWHAQRGQKDVPDTLPVTVEVPYRGLITARDQKLPFMSRATFAGLHRNIAHNLLGFFAAQRPVDKLQIQR
jgi:hypothetical protein